MKRLLVLGLLLLAGVAFAGSHSYYLIGASGGGGTEAVWHEGESKWTQDGAVWLNGESTALDKE